MLINLINAVQVKQQKFQQKDICAQNHQTNDTMSLSGYEAGQAILVRNNINFKQATVAEDFISNIEEIHINKSDNNVYLENIYPVPIKSFRDKKICEYLSLLMIFLKSPYISENSGLLKNDNSNDKNITNGVYFLKFQFMPTGIEKIKNTDEAILVFKGMLSSLYKDNIEDILAAIQNKEKELIQEKTRNSNDKSLNEINSSGFCKTIDSIKSDDIREFLSKYVISQPPIIYINEEKNPYN